MSQDIDVTMNESRLFAPVQEFIDNAHINSREQYDAMYKESIEEPEAFWGRIAETFTWKKKWDRVRNWDDAPVAKWFDGATLNITENCIDRHVAEGRGDKVAFYWEGEPGDSEAITYSDLLDRVSKAANVFKKLGVGKGDRVAIYLPMIPELAVTVLACARIGAVHTVIFGGFSAPALVDRINDCAAKLIVTSDGGYRRGKVLDLKAIVDEALEDTPCIDHCLVVKRTNNDVTMKSDRDVYWCEQHAGISGDCPAEEMAAQDPLFILYTSGSTGKPKGVQHSTAGYMIGTATTCKYIFDLKADDVYWCTADVGWITGHSYFAYGPTLNGATQVMYEGAPNFPDFDRFWDVIEKYKVSIFYTAPTAIRAFMKWGDEHVDKHDISSLRLLGTVGEPINPEAWMWYHSKIGAEKCPIVDTWWQTETGAVMIAPIPGVTATRPGCATMPFFGVDAGIVDEKGNDVADGKGGLLVIKQPWPSMLTDVYGDPERYKEVYWSRFEKQGYYLAGDGAVRDENGYITILGRIDDVINVSGHRLSTMELESVLAAHDFVAESAVVGYAHEIKGEGIAAFITAGNGVDQSQENRDLLKKYVAKEIGPFARPDQVHFTDALPKTRSGKIMRRLLKDIAAGKELKQDLSTIEDVAALHKLVEKVQAELS
jgi:acetyl-CoA synthetase